MPYYANIVILYYSSLFSTSSHFQKRQTSQRERRREDAVWKENSFLFRHRVLHLHRHPFVIISFITREPKTKHARTTYSYNKA